MRSQKLTPANRALLRRAFLLIILFAITFIAGLTSFVAVRGMMAAGGQAQGAAGPAIATGQSTQAVNAQGTPLPTNPNIPASLPTLTPWDGAGRVTILLLGLDYRDWESGSGASRSDTMILVTLDPLNKTAGILSVPRDMWVPIPGFKHGKINTAYYLGEAYKLPGGGPGLAVKTVEQFLGVPINYYAQIDFEAFVKFIDEIGGVKIDVPDKITVDLLGDNNTKTLKPGVQVLPGEWALAYARARHTEGGDFDRANRQQQVILGIRDRILSFNMLPTLIAKAPTLYSQLSSGIHTNLTLDDAIKLALAAQDVKKEDITQGVINQRYVTFGTSPDNLSILIPIPDKIQLLRDQIFTGSGAVGPETAGSALEQMKAEAASIALYDGSTGGTNLGNRTADFLRSQGANIQSVADAPERYGSTTVIDHTGSPYALKYLVETLKISPNRVYIKYDPSSPVDVELFLGDDWKVNNTLP